MVVPQPGSVASSGPSSCLPAKEISCVAALLLRHHPRLTCSSVTESGSKFSMINLYVNQRMLFKANLPVLRSYYSHAGGALSRPVPACVCEVCPPAVVTTSSEGRLLCHYKSPWPLQFISILFINSSQKREQVAGKGSFRLLLTDCTCATLTKLRS